MSKVTKLAIATSDGEVCFLNLPLSLYTNFPQGATAINRTSVSTVCKSHLVLTAVDERDQIYVSGGQLKCSMNL
jgi:hypothetical protein